MLQSLHPARWHRKTDAWIDTRLLGVSLAITLLGCSVDAPPSIAANDAVAPAPIRFVPSPRAFRSGPGPIGSVPHEILPTDFDADGDVDLWVNWHVLAPVELWENRGGSFVALLPRRSGLWENPGIPSLFATTPNLVARLQREPPAGLHLWHDGNREGNWNLFYVPATQGEADFSVRLVANQPIDDPPGLRDGEFDRSGDRELSLHVSILRSHQHVAFHVQRIATQLELFLEPTGAVPIFVGPDRTRASAPLSLWKGDPHGVTFVDVSGDPQPELYVSRGGIRGEVKPPLPPKRNYLYLRDGRETPFTMADATRMPADYGRSRRVEWVDVDNDGDLELYVGNRQTPNALWCVDSGGDYRNRAEELDLDLAEGDRFAWLDLDSDGRQDLVAYSSGSIQVGWNRDPEFEWVDGAEIGLVLPPIAPGPDTLFEELAFHVLDFDLDGELDLWVSGHGPALRSRLFVSRGAHFEEVSVPGQSNAPALKHVHWSDLDGDGYQDAVGVSDEGLILLHNVDGDEITTLPLGADWGLGKPFAATLADADGDGRDDLFLLAGERYLARHLMLNATETPDRGQRVLPEAGPRPPIGAVVRAHYSDGSTRAQRFGSAHSSGDSQTLLPLHFGVPPGADLAHYTVRWPGSPGRERFEPGTDSPRRLVRGEGRPE